MKIIYYSWIVLMVGYLSYVLYFKHLWSRPASDFCNYELPHQYYVVKDSNSGKYAILFMHIDIYPYYLREVEVYSLYPDRSIMDAGVNDATLFDDSCSAKRCFAQALKVEKEFKDGSRNFKSLNK